MKLVERRKKSFARKPSKKTFLKERNLTQNFCWKLEHVAKKQKYLSRAPLKKILKQFCKYLPFASIDDLNFRSQINQENLMKI